MISADSGEQPHASANTGEDDLIRQAIFQHDEVMFVFRVCNNKHKV